MRTRGQRRSSNIEDRRGRRARRSRTGGGATAALAPFFLRFLFSRNGRRFILPLIVAGVVAFVFFPDPTRAILGQLVAVTTGSVAPASPPLPDEEREQIEATTSVALASTEEVWTQLFREDNQRYEAPTLVLYTDATDTACGFGSAAIGPFYCPADQKVYLDLRFFSEMGRKLGAPGDFAQAYVVAHEVGHHVQLLTGVLDWAQREKQRLGPQSTGANRVEVRIELMADCLAGVWAHHAQPLLEPGDLQEALDAAEAVGDDVLQRRSQGRVVPDSFTHGTAEQRRRWLEAGFNSGDPDRCETRDIAYERL